MALSHARAVNDEWLEVLANHHGNSLTQLDVLGCGAISSGMRPLSAITQMRQLEVLRLPAERWKEHELVDALVELPRLKAVDPSTHADLRRERDALRMQCEILGHVQH